MYALLKQEPVMSDDDGEQPDLEVCDKRKPLSKSQQRKKRRKGDTGGGAKTTTVSDAQVNRREERKEARLETKKSARKAKMKQRNMEVIEERRTGNLALNPANKVFVGGLSWDTNDDTLKQFFQEQDMKVVDAKVMRKPDNPAQSRGFGFVTFSTREERNRALKEFNGTKIDGREVAVLEADGKGKDMGNKKSKMPGSR